MNDTRKSFKLLRIKNSLTQKQLSELAGVTETTIRNLENNRVKPSFELSIRLCKILNVKFESLWERDFLEL